MTGRVLRIAAGDTIGVAGRWVVLHAVTLTSGGPVDSQRTDPAGRFSLRAATLDTAANYLVSVDHQGIGYFSEPIRPDSLPTTELPPLLVFDTSAVAPPVRTAERHVLVRTPTADGSRRVVELFVLGNRGEQVRISADTGTPVWETALPGVAEDVELGLSDLAGDAIDVANGRLRVFAPIVPGERELLVGYVLPPGIDEFTVPLDQPVDLLSVLLGDSTAALSAPSLPMRGVEELEGQPLRRYGQDSIAAGTTVRIRFRAGGRALPWLWVVVPLAALALLAGFVLALRRSASPVPDDIVSADPAVLAAEIAALDAKREEIEEEAYRSRRAALKARL
ncbi:MAG: hypothetical protein AMS20_07430, partial [Gemmatimonas sp. SG8_28]